MPFTVSHIVAAIPFNKGLSKNSAISKYTAISPLIIGSMTPDIAYMTPLLVDQRVNSHSVIGIYLFCIPMGLTIYFLYHLLMAPVLVSFFPKKIQQRLNPDLFIGKLPSTPSHILVFSLVLGALTHVIWDFFTHQSGIPQHITWMNTPLMNLDGYDIMPYRVLQHLSSLVGLALLFYWLIRWYKKGNDYQQNSPDKVQHYYWQAPKNLRIFAFITLAVVSFVIAIIYGYSNLPETDVLFGLYGAQVFIRHAIVAGVAAFLICNFALGLLYRIKIEA